MKSTLVLNEIGRNAHNLHESDLIIRSDPHIVCVTGGLQIIKMAQYHTHHKRRSCVTYANNTNMANQYKPCLNLPIFLGICDQIYLKRVGFDYLKNSIEQYKRKTRKSAKLFLLSKKYHISGVSHNIRFFEPYPFVTKAGRGKYLIDVDSNKYVDYWMGHWSLILGHSPEPVKKELQKQLGSSWMHGTVNEATIRLSDILEKTVPVAEKIRYVVTGTEATMYATRIARSVTGRKVIAKIDGGWHGYTSELLKTVNWPFSKSESSGLVNERHIVSLPYNDLEKSLAILKKIRKDLAGIIIEPLLGGGGCIPATKDYLKGIQEFVHKNNSLFMLDEIVTGFRFRFGCLYPTMKLDPDVVTLGKIVGGGMPIGVMAGKKEIMEIADTRKHGKTERSYIGGGTFSANPATMVSGFSTLSYLKKNQSSIYSKINKLGEQARRQITKVFDGRVIITGMGSLFMTHFAKGGISEITNSTQAAKCDSNLLKKYHFEMIAKDGIFFLPGKLGAISNEHSGTDIKSMIAASARFSEKI